MNQIEKWARDEYRQGVSPGVAARQLCLMLGANGEAPTLKAMLESMLEDANKASFDRSLILKDFADASPEAAALARQESFERNNPHFLSEP